MDTAAEFIGGVCGCGILGPRRDGVDDSVKRGFEKPNYMKGWYVDWITERLERIEKKRLE